MAKRILYLTFYFEPDLCAGSFRNSPLVKELAGRFDGEIDVITTLPNRYQTFQADALEFEDRGNVKIHRVSIPVHKSGFSDQINSFKTYFKSVKKSVKDKHYDLVFASSSRLFTAYLGYTIAKKLRIPLYLDIRDIFTDTMHDVLKNPIMVATIPSVLKIIEAKVFRYASHINLISAGFKDYFSKYPGRNYTFFSNGIDNVFLNLPSSDPVKKKQLTITYAGNLGKSQGLEKIIPQAAKRLGNKYKFLIIGDGSAKNELLSEIKNNHLTNIEIRPPVKRADLIETYLKSDFLFIHLNDYDAFKKVLPSKVFELGAFDKPIIAGVAGYANSFIQENISNKILFLPGDVDEMVRQLENYTYHTSFRTDFLQKFQRNNIDKQLATSILEYI